MEATVPVLDSHALDEGIPDGLLPDPIEEQIQAARSWVPTDGRG
jgi:hypothetical protein